MVSGYFAGSTSTSAIASGVTQPAHTFTRGKTAASRSSGRRPARASRHAAVLPPGPPPTTMTSCPATSASHEGDDEPQPIQGRDAKVLDRVRDPHGCEQVALDVDGALDIGLGKIEGRRIAHEADEGVLAMQDHRAHGGAPEHHHRSVPARKAAPAPDAPEDPFQDGRGVRAAV